MAYEKKEITLRELKDGERFLTIDYLELIYMYPLGDDKHRISRLNGDSWDVPNGDYPVFKYIND